VIPALEFQISHLREGVNREQTASKRSAPHLAFALYSTSNEKPLERLYYRGEWEHLMTHRERGGGDHALGTYLRLIIAQILTLESLVVNSLQLLVAITLRLNSYTQNGRCVTLSRSRCA